MDTEGVTVILIGWMTTSRDNTGFIPIGGGVRVRSSTKTTSGMKMLNKIPGKIVKIEQEKQNITRRYFSRLPTACFIVNKMNMSVRGWGSLYNEVQVQQG